MMSSNQCEYSDRRSYSDRGSRRDRWDDDDRWEERRKPYRDVSRDSHHRYEADGHSRTERTRRVKEGREYSDSPERDSKDSMNRDWTRKSPVRRHMSSPDWSFSERKRQRFTEDNKDDYRNRHGPENKTYRHSPESLNVSKDFKYTLPQEEDFIYKKAPQDSRHRHRHEEFTHRKQRDDYRPLSPYHKERDHHERSWDCSQERPRSQDHSTKSLAKPRERNDDPYPDYEDPCQNRTRFPLNGSSEQSFDSDVTKQSPTVPGQMQNKGFQRFLDVLNKGVNVATLTKIVTQNSTVLDDRPRSPVSFPNTAKSLRSSSSSASQQLSQHNNCHWSKHEGSRKLSSPQHHHSSFSLKVPSLSDEQSQQRSDTGQRYFSSNQIRSRSPSVKETIALTPEDEHKHRQMQGVLQAIGLDLGFEELGQMSHRIQERLYGKKDGDRGRHHRSSKERDSRRMSSPRRGSRSSSSRSNVSPLTQDYAAKQDSYSAQRDITEVHERQVHQAGEFGQNSSSTSLPDNEKCETKSQEGSTALEAFSPNPGYTVSEAPLTPRMATYSPANCSVLPYPATPPALTPTLPPTLPHVVPGLILPRLPPFVPFPHVPPLNIFPAVLAPTRQLLPQHISSSQSPFFNLPDINPGQPLNATHKSKTLSRPRCLQVIETKQPG